MKLYTKAYARAKSYYREFGKRIYQRWYYETRVYERTTFLGIPVLKPVTDLWMYQEIIFARKPSLVVELGTAHGGSALYFSEMLKLIGPTHRVLSVDINHQEVLLDRERASSIELLTSSTVDARVKDRIKELRRDFPGPMLVSVDSDHKGDHVFKELMMLRDVTVKDDYVVVEDTFLGRNRVGASWRGNGPMEALLEYERLYPDDYVHDTGKDEKFGLTFFPKGFLIRC